MQASFNNLGFTSCIFEQAQNSGQEISNADILKTVEDATKKSELKFDLQETNGQPGKLAKLTIKNDKEEYNFFIFRSQETEMESIRIVPETDSCDIQNLEEAFSTKLHSGLQQIAKAIHLKTGADSTFSINPDHFPHTKEKALEEMSHSKHTIIGRNLACPIVNKMETLEDGSVEVISSDNPIAKKTDNGVNLSKLVIDSIQYLKKNLATLKLSLSA